MSASIGPALFDEQDDAGPLLSRCIQIRLTNQGVATAVAPLLKHIAETEGLDGRPLSAYVSLAHDCHNVERWVRSRGDARRVRVVGRNWRPRGHGHTHIYVVQENHPALM